MSIFSAGGRTTTRRYSQAALHGTNSQLQWPSPTTLRRISIPVKGRRRALDLYDTKDILFSHEQMKKTKQSTSNSKSSRIFGWVSNVNVNFYKIIRVKK
jgi:hypothetical protein